MGAAILFSLRLIWDVTEIALRLIWDKTKIPLRSNAQLWLADTNWDWTILFWDSQIDNEVVYEIYLTLGGNLRDLSSFLSEPLKEKDHFFYSWDSQLDNTENYISLTFFWDSQLEIIRNFYLTPNLSLWGSLSYIQKLRHELTALLFFSKIPSSDQMNLTKTRFLPYQWYSDAVIIRWKIKEDWITSTLLVYLQTNIFCIYKNQQQQSH